MLNAFLKSCLSHTGFTHATQVPTALTGSSVHKQHRKNHLLCDVMFGKSLACALWNPEALCSKRQKTLIKHLHRIWHERVLLVLVWWRLDKSSSLWGGQKSHVHLNWELWWNERVLLCIASPRLNNSALLWKVDVFAILSVGFTFLLNLL